MRVEAFPYVYVWGARYPRTLDRKGQRCRVLVRGGMNSAAVEFEDGFQAVVSRNALRKRRVGEVTMPCHVVKVGDTVAFVRTSGERKPKRCTFCSAAATIACDYPVRRKGRAATCDNPCCDKHAHRVGPNQDFCEFHHKAGPPKL